MKRSGGIIGSGAVAVLSARDCIIDQTKQRIGFSCYETCGKCSLGREGSYQLNEIVTDMTRGKSRAGDLELLREIGEAMQIGCMCAFGRTAPNIVLSGHGEVPRGVRGAHAKRKRCKALVCAKYVTFHILPDLCDGCGACVDECPEDAIAGGKKKIHVIDQDACEQCGRCYEVCLDLQKAVVKAGAVKPRTPKRPDPGGQLGGLTAPAPHAGRAAACAPAAPGCGRYSQPLEPPRSLPRSGPSSARSPWCCPAG